MRYLIVINVDESTNLPDTERNETTAAYRRYTEELQKAGVMLGGDALTPSGDGGARIEVIGGKRSIVDGPFAEAKEVVGGYYLIQVKSHEEAVEWAARCPGASRGSIELRRVREM